jgi:hypothetical protein
VGVEAGTESEVDVGGELLLAPEDEVAELTLEELEPDAELYIGGEPGLDDIDEDEVIMAELLELLMPGEELESEDVDILPSDDDDRDDEPIALELEPDDARDEDEEDETVPLLELAVSADDEVEPIILSEVLEDDIVPVIASEVDDEDIVEAVILPEVAVLDIIPLMLKEVESQVPNIGSQLPAPQ